jgi:hypothetical protein
MQSILRRLEPCFDAPLELLKKEFGSKGLAVSKIIAKTGTTFADASLDRCRFKLEGLS